MKRRQFITLLGGAVAAVTRPLAAVAAGPRLIGILSPLSMASAARNIEALRSGLRDLGYVEGREFAIEARFADGAVDRLAVLVAELIALRPAVIVAGALPAVLAARNATGTIPIVIAAMTADPMAVGLAVSMARPGGNVTGIWTEGDEALIGKRLELLKEAAGGLSRVGVLVDPANPSEAATLQSLPAATRALGLAARVLEVRGAADLESAFATAEREQLHGLHVSSDPLFLTYRAEIVALAARAGLPAIYSFREFPADGGLMSYAPSLPAAYRRGAAFVDRILKGASPGDLPIERPTKFEMVINLKTAKALGLTIPQTLLVAADEVIE
jgi:putative tryptophan/tyrosine transport system substrate-binding protein